MALYSTPGHSHEVANLAVAQFQNAKQNQNVLFLLRQGGKRIGNKLIVDVQSTAVGDVIVRGDVGWIFSLSANMTPETPDSARFFEKFQKYFLKRTDFQAATEKPSKPKTANRA